MRFWFFNRDCRLIIQSTTFLTNGYTFKPISTAYIVNYVLFFCTFSISVFVSDSNFINDETVSLASGFLALGYVTESIEVIGCRFEALSKNPEFSYHGVAMTIAAVVRFINNTVYNLECPPKIFASQYHINGVISLQGEDSSRFILNQKRAVVQGNSFKNCRCAYGGALSISNYHQLNMIDNTFDGNFGEQAGSFAVLSAISTKVRPPRRTTSPTL